MKSFPAFFLLILVLAAVAQLLLPWWTLAVVCFALAWWRGGSAGGALGAGFLGVGLGWLGLATWLDVQNGGLLSQRVAQLLPLGGQGWLVVAVTAVLGGLVGGLAALSGAWLHQAFTTNNALLDT